MPLTFNSEDFMGQDTQADNQAPAKAKVSGVEQLGHDLGIMAQNSAHAIALAWTTYAAPHVTVIADDFLLIAADGRRKWSEVGKVVNHPADHGVQGVSRFLTGAAGYVTGKNDLLKDGAAFIVETGAAFIDNTGKQLIKDVEAIKSGAEYVADKWHKAVKRGPSP